MSRKRTASPDPQEASVFTDPPEAAHETLLEQIQRLTPEEWQGKKVYLYRVWPIIDKKGDDHFLAKLSEPFDEDYLLKNWGSGRYHLRLNGTAGQGIASQTVAIHNPDHPPKVDPLEVVESEPRNKVYFEVWGPRAAKADTPPADTAAVQELSKLASKVLDQRSGAPAEQASGLSDAATTLLLGMSKGRDELAEKLATVAGASGGDPIAALDRAVELIKKLQADSGRPAAGDPIAALDRAVSLLQKLQPPATPQPAKSPVEQVTEMLDLYARLKENMAPAVAADSGSSLASVAAIVHEVADFLKTPVAIGMQVWAASRNRTAGAVPTAPPQTQPQQAPAQPAPPEAKAAPPDAAPAAAEPLPQSLLALANAMTPVMLRYLNVDAPGAEMGADFAGWVSDGWGLEDLKSLQALGVGNIVALYRQSPLWAALAPMESKFQEFVTAFVAWQPPTEDAESQQDGAGESEADREVVSVDV